MNEARRIKSRMRGTFATLRRLYFNNAMVQREQQELDADYLDASNWLLIIGLYNFVEQVLKKFVDEKNRPNHHKLKDCFNMIKDANPDVHNALDAGYRDFSSLQTLTQKEPGNTCLNYYLEKYLGYLDDPSDGNQVGSVRWRFFLSELISVPQINLETLYELARLCWNNYEIYGPAPKPGCESEPNPRRESESLNARLCRLFYYRFDFLWHRSPPEETPCQLLEEWQRVNKFENFLSGITRLLADEDGVLFPDGNGSIRDLFFCWKNDIRQLGRIDSTLCVGWLEEQVRELKAGRTPGSILSSEYDDARAVEMFVHAVDRLNAVGQRLVWDADSGLWKGVAAG